MESNQVRGSCKWFVTSLFLRCLLAPSNLQDMGDHPLSAGRCLFNVFAAILYGWKPSVCRCIVWHCLRDTKCCSCNARHTESIRSAARRLVLITKLPLIDFQDMLSSARSRRLTERHARRFGTHRLGISVALP
jgi:hypothetical protein